MAIQEAGGGSVKIIKPMQQDIILEYIKKAEAAGCIAVGVDVDGAGSYAMAKYKKPVESEKFYLNAYANNKGKIESNINSSLIINNKVSTALLGHAEYSTVINDHNNDGFRDEPNVKQYHLFNRREYMTENLHAKAGFKIMEEENKIPSQQEEYNEGKGEGEEEEEQEEEREDYDYQPVLYNSEKLKEAFRLITKIKIAILKDISSKKGIPYETLFLRILKTSTL